MLRIIRNNPKVQPLFDSWNAMLDYMCLIKILLKHKVVKGEACFNIWIKAELCRHGKQVKHAVTQIFGCFKISLLSLIMATIDSYMKISIKNIIKEIYFPLTFFNKMRSWAEYIFHKISSSRISFLNFNTHVTNVIHKSHERIHVLYLVCHARCAMTERQHSECNIFIKRTVMIMKWITNDCFG